MNVIKICLRFYTQPSPASLLLSLYPLPFALSWLHLLSFFFVFYFSVGSFKLEKFLPDFCFTFFIFSTGHALHVCCPCCCSWCQRVICVPRKDASSVSVSIFISIAISISIYMCSCSSTQLSWVLKTVLGNVMLISIRVPCTTLNVASSDLILGPLSSLCPIMAFA